MLLHNVRLGLATNSSSTHSLVFLPKRHRESDEEADGQFGWNNFTLVSKESRARYAGVVLRQALLRSMPANIADVIVGKWIGRGLGWKEGAPYLPETDYIDHQSLYHLPYAFSSSAPDEQFFSEFMAYLMRDDLAILGGNDNDENAHRLASGSFSLPIPKEMGHHRLVCRKDQRGKYWVVFDQESGDKFRFSFDGEPGKMKVVPTKATAPELVDVKITDWCGFGCEFCYQGSTTAGKHADADNFRYRLTHALAGLKVFEVALGGGEPTAHPDFVEILGEFRREGIVPNFTTRSLAWLRDGRQWPRIIESCGAFAFSAERVDNLKQLVALLETNGIDVEKASAQVILGVVEEYEFARILRFCHEENLRLTILGYKSTKRGAEVKPSKHDWWLDRVKKAYDDHECPRVGVDTVVAAEYSKQLVETGVPEYMFTTEEGKFSCYIDAVSGKMGPSSYCDEKEMTSISNMADEKEIARHFAAF